MKSILVKIDVFEGFRYVAFKTGVVFSARIQNETAREWISNELLYERDFESNLPPNTFALPLKNLDRLVTTISV